MEPTRVRLTSDEAGQYAMPFGAINDNDNECFKQMFTRGRLGDAEWQPVLLQRVHGQLRLPAPLLATAPDGQLIDLQVAGTCWLWYVWHL